ncbi:DUF4258 domain-containing protein [Flavobacterium agricola]|uniref:DUF4258 domain-containing protein n=1 Tax=Flavobacterium agricola TaxID=2870839 RepID=A0ABY6M0F5_9FLAO|nr:DUF4258 domain-containing protein [Flavobacterium agricola]UYW02006.1 DUF4258 domain-containing protein [Flavobacterium agricola]
MNFIQRLGYYLIGLMIGAFAVWFILHQKETETFCYLPNCRVLKDLRSKPFQTSEEANFEMKNEKMSLDDVRLNLKHGDIDFSRSNLPYETGKIYIVEGRNPENQPIELELINYPDKVVLKNIKKI